MAGFNENGEAMPSIALDDPRHPDNRAALVDDVETADSPKTKAGRSRRGRQAQAAAEAEIEKRG